MNPVEAPLTTEVDGTLETIGRPESEPLRIRPAAWRGLLTTARPRQWTKNFAIFLALFFSVNLYWRPSDLSELASKLATVGLSFVVFCLLSSAIYVVNDLVDLERDRLHPVKRHRPLAAGAVDARMALAVAAVLLLMAGIGSLLLPPIFWLIGAGYVILMVAYSFWLKNLVLIDVFAIAVGFVLRTVAGAVVIGVPVSPWLYVCTILGALFIGFGKRRHELLLLADGAAGHRRILQEYTPRLLEEIIAIVTSSTVMAYSLYTFSGENLPRNHAMMLTIPFVLYGIFRYLYLVHLRNEGGSPEEILLRDKPLIIDILLWLGVSIGILVLFR